MALQRRQGQSAGAEHGAMKVARVEPAVSTWLAIRASICARTSGVAKASRRSADGSRIARGPAKEQRHPRASRDVRVEAMPRALPTDLRSARLWSRPWSGGPRATWVCLVKQTVVCYNGHNRWRSDVFGPPKVRCGQKLPLASVAR